MKRLSALLACWALLLVPALALASPLPYINTPLDTVQAAANAVTQNINTSTSFPEAQYLTLATGSAGAATCNSLKCSITTEALTTAAAATYTETVADSAVTASSIVIPIVRYGTSTTGAPNIVTVTPSAGQVIITVQNIAASAALNGTIVISYVVFN